MAQFTKVIQVDNVNLEFWFTGTTTYRRSFYVTAEDKHQRFISFHMEEVSENKWKIVDNKELPSGIYELEEEFSKIIKKNTPI